MKTRALLAVVLLAGPLFAQQPPLRKVMIRSEQKFTLAPGGTFVLDNASGNIEIMGADVTDVEASIASEIHAANNDSLAAARKGSGLLIGGDENTRIVRTAVVANAKGSWSVRVHWRIRVPRDANVRVNSGSSDRIRLVNLNGGAHVKNFNGNIVLTEVLGAATVESVNGSIAYATRRPKGNVMLSSVNGHISASVDPGIDFRWVAETATGDILTNLPARGAWFGATFRGSINAPGGPTITTRSMMGNVHMLAAGVTTATAQSLRKVAAVPQMTSASTPRVMRRGTVTGLFRYATNLGDVRVQEILGDADVKTGAGEVQIGAVSGAATVRSEGGPLHLGEVLGIINASTRAGDILIDSTRRGGMITTEGGSIRLLYTSGPTRLRSGGGDITVRQAAAPIDARTTSGDIAITVDSKSKSEQIDARTAKGNIVLTVSEQFGADVDATIITSDPQADAILSELPGLVIHRHTTGGQVHIRATGKLNGGGRKVVLYATGGDIRIVTGRAAPTVVKR